MLYKIVWFSAIHQQESALGALISHPSQASLPSPSSSHPSRLSQSPCLSSLSHIANSHWLSTLYRGLECKSRRSRETWSNRQVWPWSTKWSRAKANRVLPRKCTSHSKHPLLPTQEKTLHMDITRKSILISDWLHSLQPTMDKFYTVSKNKIWLWLRSWTPYCQIQT